MTVPRQLRITVPALCLLLAGVAAADGQPGPREVVESMQQGVLDSLAHAGPTMERDPERFYALVRHQLRPHFDLELAGRAILGTSWRTASEAERTAFHSAFEDYLVTTYAMALRHMTAETLAVMAGPRRIDEREVMLPVRLVLVDTQVIEAELRMRQSDVGWRIWDAGAGGMSLVRLYRGDISTEAAAHGLGHVVDSLRDLAARNRARDLERVQQQPRDAPSR